MPNIMKLMKQAADMQKSMARHGIAGGHRLEHSAGRAVTVKIMGDGNIARSD